MFVCDLAITFRDAPITIFLADSYFRFVCEPDLQIPIFADSDFLSKNNNRQHIQTKIYANFNDNIFT